MNVTIHSHWTFLADPGTDLPAYGDKVMRAMLDLEQSDAGCSDSAVSVDATKGILEIEADGVGQDLQGTIAMIHATVRAALHAVGIGTPDWPTHDEVMSMVLTDLQTETVQPQGCSGT